MEESSSCTAYLSRMLGSWSRVSLTAYLSVLRSSAASILPVVLSSSQELFLGYISSTSFLASAMIIDLFFILLTEYEWKSLVGGGLGAGMIEIFSFALAFQSEDSSDVVLLSLLGEEGGEFHNKIALARSSSSIPAVHAKVSFRVVDGRVKMAVEMGSFSGGVHDGKLLRDSDHTDIGTEQSLNSCCNDIGKEQSLMSCFGDSTDEYSRMSVCDDDDDENKFELRF